jgi:hypothetical protein
LWWGKDSSIPISLETFDCLGKVMRKRASLTYKFWNELPEDAVGALLQTKQF